MKIKKITVKNFKPVSDQELELNGASVVVTAGNNKGKSSILKGLIDRFRGERPEIIVKDGEEKGINQMELTDGSKIEWRFTKKTENFSFTTAEDIKMTTGVLKGIGEKYFGIKFDIDKFMSSSKTEALKMVQKLVGLDFTELNEKHKEHFDNRTIANRELKNLRANKIEKPEEVSFENIDSLKKEKEKLIQKNNQIKVDWDIKNQEFQKETLEFNDTQENISNAIAHYSNALDDLKKYKGTATGSFIDYKGIQKALDNIPEPKESKELKSLEEPKLNSLEEIEEKIDKAYQNKSKADAYERELSDYNNWVSNGAKKKKEVDELNKKLDKIQETKMNLIQKSSLPDEFEITDDGLLYKGLPVDDNQLSSSVKYICALKLGSLVLGKLRTLHFDASFLDKNSLEEIQLWANKNNLQLLIERPDWNGGDIKYEIIEE